MSETDGGFLVFDVMMIDFFFFFCCWKEFFPPWKIGAIAVRSDVLHLSPPLRYVQTVDEPASEGLA